MPPLAFAAGTFALASAATSIAYSMKCLMSTSFSVGADPVALALASPLSPVEVKQGLADSLAVAAESLRVTLAETGYSLRSLKVEKVVAGTNLREPEIPDPRSVQSRHPCYYRRAGGEAIVDGCVAVVIAYRCSS